PTPSTKKIVVGVDYRSRFICRRCNIEFPTRQALHKHRLTHSRFRCPQCGKETTDKPSLEDHLRRHNGLKPFKCPFPGSSPSSRCTEEAHAVLKIVTAHLPDESI